MYHDNLFKVQTSQLQSWLLIYFGYIGHGVLGSSTHELSGKLNHGVLGSSTRNPQFTLDRPAKLAKIAPKNTQGSFPCSSTQPQFILFGNRDSELRSILKQPKVEIPDYEPIIKQPNNFIIDNNKKKKDKVYGFESFYRSLDCVWLYTYMRYENPMPT